MSLHAFSRVWLHLVWATLERRPLLRPPLGPKLSSFLGQYSAEKGIYMKINFVNAEHVHALVDLPTSLCIEEMMQLFKGASSHWINETEVVPGKFALGRGYGVFSVSQSNVAEVAHYIAGQEEHHHRKGYLEELKLFVERYELEWHDDRNR